MKIVTTTSVFPKAASLLQKSLEDLLSKHGKFLLFLSGGSAVKVYQKLIPWVEGFEDDLSKSAIVLVDERYSVKPNHAGSNAVTIEKSGLFAVLRKQGVRIETILHGGSMEEEVERYNGVVQNLLASQGDALRGYLSGSLIGIFGIGTDGHTAGMFPFSKENFIKTYGGSRYVVGHEKGTPPYQERITITPYAIKHIGQILLIVQGESKALALQRFKCLSYDDRHNVPAVVLKKAKHVTVVTDQDDEENCPSF